jgi:hypothetical protein
MKDLAEHYIQAAIGQHTHVPINIIFQGNEDPNKVTGIFQFHASQTTIKALTCNADLQHNHVLLLGDAFIRSRVIIQSQPFLGRGISSLYRDGFIDMDTWIKGKMLKDETK